MWREKRKEAEEEKREAESLKVRSQQLDAKLKRTCELVVYHAVSISSFTMPKIHTKCVFRMDRTLW
jgi:hypothetical protein